MNFIWEIDEKGTIYPLHYFPFFISKITLLLSFFCIVSF